MLARSAKWKLIGDRSAAVASSGYWYDVMPLFLLRYMKSSIDWTMCASGQHEGIELAML